MPYMTHKGNRIAYRMKGDGPLLIILPGNTASSVAHEADLDHFSDRYRTVAFDLVGTGGSNRLQSWPVSWWDDGGEQAIALMDHLGYQGGSLLGTSGGAIAALSAADGQPKRVTAVVADSFQLNFTEQMFRQNILTQRTEPNDSQKAFWEAMHGEDWQQVIQADTDMIRQVVKRGGMSISGPLERIEAAVLATFSTEDSMLPDVSQFSLWLQERIPDCIVKIFSEGDHPLIWTNRRSFLEVVDEFLSERD